MSEYIRHVIKFDHQNGRELPKHEVVTWCGAQLQPFDWAFVDAQHALLCIEKNHWQIPCKDCLAAMIGLAESAHENI